MSVSLDPLLEEVCLKGMYDGKICLMTSTGCSWSTNQYGLTIDTVQAFKLVMPNGTALNVTDTTSPDLFFALKVCAFLDRS